MGSRIKNIYYVVRLRSSLYRRKAISSLRSSAEKRSIEKASTLEDSAVDFQYVFLLFLKEEDSIYTNKVY